MSLRLVLQLDDLIGIAVEGLSPADQSIASAETVEIADLVFYYGKRSHFGQARTVAITQAKYSIRKANSPFRAADAAKTIGKFAGAYREHQKLYGKKAVAAKLEFEIVTNRPIARVFKEALRRLARGHALFGEVKEQADQFKAVCGLTGRELSAFAKKIGITGASGSLRENKDLASRVVADWSGGQDSMARLRLAELRALVRDKAGSTGQGRNLIKRVDVLAAMHLQSETDLLPFPPRFPNVGTVVPREQLADTVKMVPLLKKPLLVHAAGGMGKTVFLQSLVAKLSVEHKCVEFDCFGGGVYRAPDDGRHRPSRGAVQIINHLACSGLCDPLLPSNENVEALFSTFRRRLSQCVATLRKVSPGKLLILMIDAIDNAAMQAEARKEDCFPKLLLESFETAGQIDGVKVVVSCRSHRRPLAKGDIDCEEIELNAFSQAETGKFLRDRILNVGDAQIHVAQSRSGGNPRILEHLSRMRELLKPSQLNQPITLDDLLKERIKSALGEAMKQGYKTEEIRSFLAGLSVLPPPVPLKDYAEAHGWDMSAVKSFAADLSPLLEQTKHGLTFRDEPTETYILEHYAADKRILHVLSKNLLAIQGTSVYAANALPNLLERLDDGKRLFALAFNDSLPKTITSTVGKQKIRYSRIKAAVLHAARKHNCNHLVRLLVELSTVASINKRGTDYLVDNPELAVISQDADAVRRLVEDRSRWAGTKHARVAIASALSQDPNDALRHAITANDWFQHYYGQDDNLRRQRPGPSPLDVAAIPLCLIALDRGKDAVRFVGGYHAWFAFAVSEHLFRLLSIGQALGSFPTANVFHFLDSMKNEIGLLAGSLAFFELDDPWRRKVIRKLSAACVRAKTIERLRDDFSQSREHRLQDGLLKSISLAIYSGLKKEARNIAKATPISSGNVYVFFDRFGTRDAFPFVASAVVHAAAEDEAVQYQALLPQELLEAGANLGSGLSLDQFCKALKAESKKRHDAELKLPKEKRSPGFHRSGESDRFIEERLVPLHEMSAAFRNTFSRNGEARKLGVIEIVKVWERLRSLPGRYSGPGEIDHLFNNLGRQLLEFALWTGSILDEETVSLVIQKLSADPGFSEYSLIETVSTLSKHTHLHELAGRTAIIAKARIEQGDDVSSRAAMFSRLSKAISLASLDEAKTYFLDGLEQMDAIGSGDYQFTNELLSFVGALKGKGLDPEEFHTLSNLCELNLTSDEDKYPWADFGKAFARVAGCRALAKLGRWQDRGKVSLNYSLLPYVYALLDQDKMDPAIALGLLRLTNPAELYSCGTGQLAKLIEGKAYSNGKELISEVIKQLEANNPGCGIASTTRELAEVASRIFGDSSEVGRRLTAAGLHFDKIRQEQNARSNYRSGIDSKPDWEKKQKQERKKQSVAIRHALRKADPCVGSSLSKAIASFSGLQQSFDLKKEFLAQVRRRVNFSDRPKHLEALAKLDNVELFAKLDALKACKAEWSDSSQAVKARFKNLAVTIVAIHADDFVTHEHLYGSALRELADLCTLDVQELVLELIRQFASPDHDLPPSVWLQLATFILSRANPKEGQEALIRLLRGGTARLSDSVFDGKWKSDLYPSNDQTAVAGGLTWLMLGSPSVLDRWHAAHAVRTFARFGKWRVIDGLVSRYAERDAAPFQAPELPFYFLHARLWLLLSLHRLSLEYPGQVARYSRPLRTIALRTSEFHVLLRHFASRTLLNCQAKGSLNLSKQEQKQFEAVNKSPFDPIKIKQFTSGDFHSGRPESNPEPETSFRLDYDFSKYSVESVGRLFDVPRWIIEDNISTWVRKYDKVVKNMYELGGRESSDYAERQKSINSRQQGYGNQLGWHALHVVTGQLLAKMPIVVGPYDDENPWPAWFSRQALTRNDGLWLSDGMDHAPLETQVNLLEIAAGSKITSSKHKLLSLLKLDEESSGEVVIEGHWSSADEVSVMIWSALALPTAAHRIAEAVSKADGFSARLPWEDDCDDFADPSKTKRRKTISWVVSPYIEPALDENDPLGSGISMCRPHFVDEIGTKWKLQATDVFNRSWVDSEGKTICQCAAWGSSKTYRDGESNTGTRMTTSRDFLRRLLNKENLDLLVLVVLRKYERGYSGDKSRFWHTTAVVRITKSFALTYFPGLASEEHKSNA